MEQKFDKMWQQMVEANIANDGEIELVCMINGYSLQTLEDILYAKTGLRSYEQLQDELNNQ